MRLIAIILPALLLILQLNIASAEDIFINGSDAIWNISVAEPSGNALDSSDGLAIDFYSDIYLKNVDHIWNVSVAAPSGNALDSGDGSSIDFYSDIYLKNFDHVWNVSVAAPSGNALDSGDGSSIDFYSDIYLKNADHVWNLSVAAPSGNALDSGDGSPIDFYSDIYLKNVDHVWNMNATGPSDDTLDSGDGSSINFYSDIYLKNVDYVWNVSVTRPSNDTLDSSNDSSIDFYSDIYLKNVDYVWNVSVTIPSDAALDSGDGSSIDFYSDIYLKNNDYVWNVSVTGPSNDTLDSSNDSSIDFYSDIYLKNVDYVWNVSVTVPSDAALDSVDGSSIDFYSDMYLKNVDYVWNVSVTEPSNDALNSTEAIPIDITKPLIILFSPVNNMNSTLPFITFNFTAIDNENTSLTYNFYLDGKLVNSSSFFNATPVILTLLVDSRSHAWYVEVIDGARMKNKATGETRIFNSYTDLYVSKISVSNNNPIQEGSITVNATVENSGINASSVDIYVRDENNSLIGTKRFSITSGGIYSFNLPWNLAGLAPGNHSAIVEIAQYPYLDAYLANNIASVNISIRKDIWPPYFSEIILSPANITEHSSAVKFTLNIKDPNTGVNVSSAKLHYVLNESWNVISLTFAGNDKYEVALTEDWDRNQGSSITFYTSASDKNDNYNESALQQEYIDIINDIPVITIISPKNFSAWGGTRLVEWSCNNDNEGPCYSSVYYWKPHLWAPAYPDPKYWQQGVWVKLSDAGENTSYLWNTFGINGRTKINITATDGTYYVFNVSGEFTIDNNNVTLSIENYYHSASLAFVTNTTGFIHGRVNGIDSKITSIGINRTNYTLTASPIGRIESNYSFTSDIPITYPFSATIDAQDEAGNPGTITGFFIIDDAPPVIENISLYSPYTNATATIRVAASDNYGVSMVKATVPTSSGFKEITLKPNSTLYEGEFIVPAIAGNYSINISAVDIAGNINRTSLNFTVFQGPELSIRPEDISFTPLTIVTGGIVNITANIHNTGGQNATGVNVSFYTNLKLINSMFIDLPANSNLPALISWNTTGLAGNVTIMAKIERSNGVYEVNYSNNSASSKYFVDAPDFVVSGENISFQPDASVYSGMTVKVFAKIINLRSVGADNVRVNFYAGSTEIKNLIGSDIINIQNSTIATIEWNTIGYLFDQTIYVRINPDNSSPELNVSNNIASRNFFINRYVGEQIPETLTFLKLPLQNVTHSKNRGMASGDFNNDSRIDFAIGTESGEIIVYENNGTVLTNNDRNRIVNFTPKLIAALSAKAYGLTSGDYHHDGYNDIVAGTEDGNVWLLNNTQGIFTKAVLFDAGNEAFGLSTADYDEDGDLDLVVGDRTGHVSIYRNVDMNVTFDRIITTREQPYGMTSGDYDLNGHVDVIVGDRLGQLDRVMNENGTYRSYLFADIGSFAHGLTTADFDFNGKLDIAAIGFDGEVNLFYRRGEGLVMDPLKLASSQSTYGITSGDYDQDNDIDIVLGTDSGDVYLLLNSLYIKKYTSRNPMPTSRTVEVTTILENPWVKRIENLNVLEEWGGGMEFVNNSYAPMISPGDWYEPPQYFYSDIHIYDGPLTGRYKYEYYVKLPDRGCIRSYDTYYGKWSYCNQYFTLNRAGKNTSNSLDMGSFFDLFNIEGLYQRESIKYSYFLKSNDSGIAPIITNTTYLISGRFVTYPTNFLLSDDVSNVKDSSANIKNLNPSEYHNDRGYYDEEIRAPDFTISSMYQEPGTQKVRVQVTNLNNIAIENVELFILIEGNFSEKRIFDIGAYGNVWFDYYYGSAILNVTAWANMNMTVIETNYSNNNRTILYQPLPIIPPPTVIYEYVDLVPVNISFDHVPKEGESFTVNVTVENRGVNTSTKESLYFVPGSIDQTWMNRTVECYTGSPYYDNNICSRVFNQYPPYPRIDYSIPIAPGGNYTFRATFSTSNVHRSSQGTWIYNVLVYAQGYRQIEMNDTNNAMSKPLTVLPSDVDLTMYYNEYGSYSPILLSNPDSDNISLNIVEFNTGGTFAENHSMMVYHDNNMSNVIYRTDNLTLQKHSSRGISFVKNWSSIPAGDHLLYFYFDSFNEVNESSEGNNIFTKQFNWKELVATKEPISYSIQNPTVGDLVYISAYIGNDGDIRTGNFTASLYINNKLISNQIISLLARENKWISFPWKSTAGRNQEVKVVLDLENIIIQEEESNNIAYSTIKVSDSGWETEILSEVLDQEHLSVFDNNAGIWSAADYNFSNIPVSRNAVPRFADLDADGDPDLILGKLDGNLKGYKNIGPASNPAWIEYNWNLPVIDVGFRSAPAFADLNNDGKLDFVLPDYKRYLTVYENTGTPTAPIWKRNDAAFGLDKIRIDLYDKPSFIDIDGDGDLDLFLGTREGRLVSYENTGNASKPVFEPAKWNLSAIDVGSYASPAFLDLDGDSDHDLIVGSGSGLVFKYENTGNSTIPVFETIEMLPMKYNSSASPALSDLDVDGLSELVIGSNSENLMGMMQGYSYPIKIKVINYASYGLSIYRDKLQFLNQTDLKKVTDVYLDLGFYVPPVSMLTKEYVVTVPRDIPPGTLLGVTSERNYGVSQGWNTNPELGGYTTSLYPQNNTVYLIGAPYRIYSNGTMNEGLNCNSPCPLINFTENDAIVTNSPASITAFEKDRETKFQVIPPVKPAVDIFLDKLGDFYNLKPGYQENIEFIIENNNIIPYKVNRIVLELEKNGTFYDLYTDTTGFTLPAKNQTTRKYKVYVPEGVPLDAAFHLKVMEKFTLPDTIWHRSNTNIWDNDTIFVDEHYWDSQNFTGPNFWSWENGRTFLRKHIWLESSLQKAEFRQEVKQKQLSDYWWDVEESGITTYFNRKYYSKIETNLDEGITSSTYGWTPMYYDLKQGDNEFTLDSYGPLRTWETTFYDLIAWNRVYGATVEAKPAFRIEVTSLGQNNSGLLRRQYEEPVNVTVSNNDDDPITVEVMTFDLITPANRTLKLFTDLNPRTYAGNINQTMTYMVTIPGDVPVGSKLQVTAEKVFSLPDKLWLRDHEATKEELLSTDTKDYGWGDTLPTSDINNYRKQIFAPSNVTRMEAILGTTSELYLNGLYQGREYIGWSPLAVNSGLRKGENNLISIIGAIPDTESRIYSGKSFVKGEIVQPEEDSFYTVFGMREGRYVPDRERFHVYPGEDIKARIKIDNFYPSTREFALRLYTVDFEKIKETTLDMRSITVPGGNSKYLEIAVHIPESMSNDTKLQLYSKWNEVVADKAWLRASNVKDDAARNNFIDDSSWGVIGLSSANEKAKYFRKHLWIDSLTEDVQFSLTKVEKLWVNGLEVPISNWGSGYYSLTKNEITKSDENLIALKAKDYDVNADIKLVHFVPIKTTDLDLFNLSAMNLTPFNTSCFNLTTCDFHVKQGEPVKFNFTVRNTGELYARDFNLTIYARHNKTGKITTLMLENMIMKPYSDRVMNMIWNTTKFAGMYDVVIYADKEDVIIESSELNNYLSMRIYVNAPPVINYLDLVEKQGFGEPVDIKANITDEDGNLKLVWVNITTPRNDTQSFNMSNYSLNMFRFTYVNYTGGRYNLTVKAEDMLGLFGEISSSFELYDTLKIPMKTERDRYYYGEHVKFYNVSAIRNLETTNTSIDIISGIEYFNSSGAWNLENSTRRRIRLGGNSQILLNTIWQPWDSRSAKAFNGTYRVVVEAVDPWNNTIINRDGTPAKEYYNFTITNSNTVPELSGIPDKYALENLSPKKKWINLLRYISDNAQDPRGFVYEIVNQTNASLINCSIEEKYYITCSTPPENQTGSSKVNVSAFDGQFFDFDEFEVTVVETLQYDKTRITYSYSPPLDENGEWQTGENDTGIYTVTVTASDGLVSDSRKVNITILDIPFIISFVEPTPLNNTTLNVDHLRINITSNRNMSTALLDWNGINESMNGSGKNWSVEKTNLSDGNYTIRVYGNDSSNNWNATETRIIEINTIIPDTQAPVITFVSPTPDNNSLLANNSTMVNISASESLDTAILEWNGINETMSGYGRNWSIEKTNLTDGKYTFKVYGNDTSNNWNSTETRTIEINTTIPDTQAPVILFVSPTPENNSVQANNSTMVNITVSESLATAILEWNGINESMGGSGQNWSIEKTNLSDGKYTFKVYGNDTSNNWNSTETRTIEINTTIPDTQAPVISLVLPTPENNSVLSNNFTTINITASESLATAILEWNGINETMSGYGRNWSIEKTNLTDGKYTFKVYGNDTSNNWNSTETRTIEINTTIPDTQAPVILFVSPTPENNSVLANNFATVNITASESLATAILECNGINGTMNGSGSNWIINKTDLVDGNYTFRVYGNDTSNNWNSTELRIIQINTIIPDTEAPVLVFVPPTPDNNSVLAVNYAVVNITANESLAIAILEWNGVNESMSGSGMNWSIEKTNLSDGKYTFKVYGNDTSNNWNSTETRTIEINTTIPDIQDPVITFVSPTPKNNSVLSVYYTVINITSNEPIDTAILEWNGINESMQGAGTNWHINKTDLIDGNYTFKVYGNDTSNNWNSTELRIIQINTIIPDTEAPVLVFVPPTPDNYSVLSVNYGFINITSNESLATAILEWNGVNESMSGSGMNWSIEKTNLSDGKYTFKVYGNDTSNNWNSTETRTFEINTTIPDIQDPVITFVSPTPKNNSVLSVNYTVINITSNEPLVTSILEWNGINESMQGAGNNWNINKTDLSDGNYSFRVYGNDTSNNWNSTELRTIEIRTVIPDIDAPIIEFAPPTPDNNSVLSVNYTVINITSNEPLDTAILEWNGINESVQGAGNNWNINKTDLSDGNYSFRVYGNDTSNNWNSTELRTIEISTVIPDIDAPVLEFALPTPENNSVLSVNYSVINITSTEPLVKAILEWNGINESMQGAGTNWNINKTDLSDGNYTFRVYGNDTSNNWNSTELRTIEISTVIPDIDAPVLVFVPPTPDNHSVLSVNYGFINITSNEPLYTAILEWNGINESMQGAGTNWNINKTDLSDGNYTFRVYGNDTSNNWNSTELRTIEISTVIPDIDAPVLVFVPPTPDNHSVLSVNYSVINITSTEPLVTSIIEWNGINESMQGAGTNWNINKTDLIDGNYSFRVYGNDTSNNWNSTGTRSIKINSIIPDMQPPVITFVPPTPENNSALSVNSTLIKITSNENLSTAILEWNGTNQIMQGSGTSWSIEKANLNNGNYTFRVRGNDSSNNWNATETRIIKINTSRATLYAIIKIEPETINLASKGVFTAFIELPGYDISEINGSTLIAEGAPAIDGKASNKKYIAKFNVQDLVNVTTGVAVKLTVKGIYNSSTPFEGFDIITVINIKDEPKDGNKGGGGGGARTGDDDVKSPNMNCTYEVVSGNKTEKDRSIRIEELKGTSKLVTAPAPGNVYLNFNVWSERRNVESALLRCRVENSWIVSNGFERSDVKILMWNESNWLELDTLEKTKDRDYTHYEAKTNEFSAFAVSALNRTVKSEVVKTPEVVEKLEVVPKVKPKSLFWILYVLAAILIIGYYYEKKRRANK